MPRVEEPEVSAARGILEDAPSQDLELQWNNLVQEYITNDSKEGTLEDPLWKKYNHPEVYNTADGGGLKDSKKKLYKSKSIFSDRLKSPEKAYSDQRSNYSSGSGMNMLGSYDGIAL